MTASQFVSEIWEKFVKITEVGRFLNEKPRKNCKKEPVALLTQRFYKGKKIIRSRGDFSTYGKSWWVFLHIFGAKGAENVHFATPKVPLRHFSDFVEKLWLRNAIKSYLSVTCFSQFSHGIVKIKKIEIL